jgi:hypothetical protein
MEHLKNFKRRKLKKCICNHCGVEFEKPDSEIKRNLKLNRNNYCSRICTGKHVGKNNFGNKTPIRRSGYTNCRTDEFSKFRYYYRSIRNRFKDVDITLEDLKNQWENQNGVCEFSGIKLILSTYKKIIKNSIYAASVDRIDSNKGYVKGNIKWVSVAINYMKNTMTEEMVWELCGHISNNYIKKTNTH